MIGTILALLQIIIIICNNYQNCSKKGPYVSPYEMLFGLPYVGREEGLAETKDFYLKNYLQAITLSLMNLRRKGLLPQHHLSTFLYTR